MSIPTVMSMATKLVAVALVFAAIFYIVLQFFRPRYVRKEEEWRASYGLKTDRWKFTVHTLMGSTVLFVIALAVTGRLHLALFGILGGPFVAGVLKKRREARRLAMLRGQFLLVIGNMSSALAGGISPYQAIEEITPSLPSPAREVFIGILRQTRAGQGYLEAIRDAREATGWKDLDLLATALDIYRNTGGNIVEVLRYLQENIAAREADVRYTNALLAQIRLTARMLSFLPLFLVGVARILAPDFMEPLLDDPVGNLLLFGVIISTLFGNVMIENTIKKTVG